MKPGIYSGVRHSDLPPGLSPSGAKTLLRLPAEYAWERGHPKAPTRSQVIGTCVHALVLEGRKTYAVVGNRATKAGKAEAAAAAEAGLTAVTAAEASDIEGMAQAVLEHPTAAGILSDGAPEQAVIWADPDTGVTCRGFIDWLRGNAIVDLKTAKDASPSGFGKDAANLHYDLQAAFYQDGIEHLTGETLPFLHVAVENTAPYFVAVHQLPPEALDRGQYDMRRAIYLYNECVSTGEWPAYGDEVIRTEWPRWAR